MASRTEDWGLLDRGRDAGDCVFLLGESADSLTAGVHVLAAWPRGQDAGACGDCVDSGLLASAHCGATSCRRVCLGCVRGLGCKSLEGGNECGVWPLVLNSREEKHGCRDVRATQRSAESFAVTVNRHHEGPLAIRVPSGPAGRCRTMAGLRSVMVVAQSLLVRKLR